MVTLSLILPPLTKQGGGGGGGGGGYNGIPILVTPEHLVVLVVVLDRDTTEQVLQQDLLDPNTPASTSQAMEMMVVMETGRCWRWRTLVVAVVVPVEKQAGTTHNKLAVMVVAGVRISLLQDQQIQGELVARTSLVQMLDGLLAGGGGGVNSSTGTGGGPLVVHMLVAEMVPMDPNTPDMNGDAGLPALVEVVVVQETITVEQGAGQWWIRYCCSSLSNWFSSNRISKSNWWNN